MLERLHIIICLFAAIVMCAVGFIQEITLQQMVFRLILTIIIFFIIGAVVKQYLISTIFKENEFPNEGLDSTEDDESVIVQDNEDELNLQGDTEKEDNGIFN